MWEFSKRHVTGRDIRSGGTLFVDPHRVEDPPCDSGPLVERSGLRDLSMGCEKGKKEHFEVANSDNRCSRGPTD